MGCLEGFIDYRLMEVYCCILPLLGLDRPAALHALEVAHQDIKFKAPCIEPNIPRTPNVQAMRSLSVRVWQQAGVCICERWQIP